MKLTLRDLFWLTLVVACLCGWFIHAMSLEQEAIRAQSALLGAEIRLEKAEDDNREWSDQYNAILDALASKGYVAQWNHHFRTVSLELKDH